MLVTFVVLYLVFSMLIGLWAARKVHSASDYISAGRSLPLYIVTAMVFATWFGAETVLGIPGTFQESNLGGLISDPFGAAICLVLFGVFIAKKLYRMNLLTIGDYYRKRYDRKIEIVTGIAIALSYLGWVSAQITALGLVFSMLSDGYFSQAQGIMIGAAVVFVYTVVGGMWSVAMTTFFQMIVIVLGLFYIAWVISDMTGGVMPVLEHAANAGRLEFWPEADGVAWVVFLSGFLTMAFGSIPQQDVFQRANSSKNESVAMWGGVLGGSFYLLFAAVPLFMTYAANLIDPELVARLADGNAEAILPELIRMHLPLLIQVVFYGALLAVIMSTASGTLLAPSVTLSENVLRGWLAHDMTDKEMLRLTRFVVAVFSMAVTLYALWALDNDTSIHAMVEAAYKVTLVTAFAPLVFGLYWKRASIFGAYLSIGLGLAVWIPLEIVMGDADISPHFWGFLVAMAGMVVGSLVRPDGGDWEGSPTGLAARS